MDFMRPYNMWVLHALEWKLTNNKVPKEVAKFMQSMHLSNTEWLLEQGNSKVGIVFK